MNLKAILLICLSASLGFLIYWVMTVSIQNSKIVFIEEIQGCAVNGKAIKSNKFLKEKKAEIEVIDNQIIYSRVLSHLCCRTAKLKYEINGNVIKIYEIWEGIACKCICFSNITARIENLPAGEYRLYVYKTGVKPDGKTVMKPELIISKDVIVR